MVPWAVCQLQEVVPAALRSAHPSYLTSLCRKGLQRPAQPVFPESGHPAGAHRSSEAASAAEIPTLHPPTHCAR
eukprot:4487122-Alexandrium_andersonii.AAC.1